MKDYPYVIDFHVHLVDYKEPAQTVDDLMVEILGSEEALNAFVDKYKDPEIVSQHLKAQGVDYSVILGEYSPLTCGYATHEMVAEFCKGRKEFIPFCSFNPYIEPDACAKLRELHALGFKGIKLYPTYDHFYVNEAKLYPLYSVAQELEIPILIHTGTSVFKNSRLKYGNPIYVDDVAVDFPNLTLVMAHGGRTAWYDEAMMLARLHKNVYIDIAGLAGKKLLVNFPDLERFSHKFVFGTDWPQIEPKKYIETIESLGLSEQAVKNIVGLNAAKIFKLM